MSDSPYLSNSAIEKRIKDPMPDSLRFREFEGAVGTREISLQALLGGAYERDDSGLPGYRVTGPMNRTFILEDNGGYPVGFFVEELLQHFEVPSDEELRKARVVGEQGVLAGLEDDVFYLKDRRTGEIYEVPSSTTIAIEYPTRPPDSREDSTARLSLQKVLTEYGWDGDRQLTPIERVGGRGIKFVTPDEEVTLTLPYTQVLGNWSYFGPEEDDTEPVVSGGQMVLGQKPPEEAK